METYITEYLAKAKNDQVHRISSVLGLNETMLRNMMSLKLNVNNINEFGRFDELKKTVDKSKARQYFEAIEGRKIIPPKVNVKVDNLLREFILSDGVDIILPTDRDNEKINYLEYYPNFEDLPMVAEGKVEYGDK